MGPVDRWMAGTQNPNKERDNAIALAEAAVWRRKRGVHSQDLAMIREVYCGCDVCGWKPRRTGDLAGD